MTVRDVIYFRTHEVHQLTKEDYDGVLDSGMFYVFYPKACGIYEDDVAKVLLDEVAKSNQEMGLYSSHDENPDGVGWPYEMGDSYLEKVTNVTQEHFDAFIGEIDPCEHEMVYQGHGHLYDIFKCIKCKHEEER